MNIPVLPSILAAFLCFSFNSLAKSPKKNIGKNTPAPKPLAERKGRAPAGESAYVRIWKNDFSTDGPMRTQIGSDQPGSAPVGVDVEAKGFRFTRYLQVPAGAVNITISVPEQAGTAPETFPGKFAPGSFSTLLIQQKDGKFSIETIDDSKPGSKDEDAELTVRNFVRDLTEIRVEAGDDLQARVHGPDGFLYVKGLDRQLLPIHTTARFASGKEAKWANEIDFHLAGKATLLIFVDPYGRIRPRVVFDGVNPKIPLEAGETPVPAPETPSAEAPSTDAPTADGQAANTPLPAEPAPEPGKGQ